MAQRLDVSAADALGARHIVDWIEARLGPVVALERLARWRPSWNADVRANGLTLALYVRGERGADFPAPFPLEHEVAVHDLLERHGVLVPHVHGLVIDGPVRAIVMDRIDGRQGLAFASDDATKAALARAAIEQMYTMHRIPVRELASLAMPVPAGLDIVVSELFRRAEESYVSCAAGPDPVIEFLRRWVWRNAPHDAAHPVLVAHDAGQFLHHEGRLTAMIDFEMAHLGDPYMDLAALRLRDTMEPWGDLRPAFARYEELSGTPLDYQRLRYFEVSYATITPLLQYPVLMNPGPDTDYMSHLTWYVDNVRYALDVLAERVAIELEPLDTNSPHHDFSSPARRHLVRWLRQGARSESATDLTRYGVATNADPAPAAAPAAPAEDFGGWRQRCAYRLARHLARRDELGAEHDRANRDDIEHLLGDRFDSLHTADAALVDFCRNADADHDVDLLLLFDRRFQRLHQTLGPADSLIVRHPPLQSFE